MVNTFTPSQKLNNNTRVFNYLGRSCNFAAGDDQDLNGVLDELKIFNKALSQQEIQNEMNND